MKMVRITWMEHGTMKYRDIPGMDIATVCMAIWSYCPDASSLLKVELVPVEG